MHGEQKRLFEETVEADPEAIGLDLDALKRADQKVLPQDTPKRAPLPAHLPRVDVRQESEDIVCGCGCALKRIGEDVSEKLDYLPGVFTVERHIHGKCACAKCQALIQAPVPST